MTLPPPPSFRVYCVQPNNSSGLSSPSPIEQLFSQAVTQSWIDAHPGARAPQVIKSVRTISEPSIPSRGVDTRYGVCGKRGCSTCTTNSFLTPSTLDYEIFRTIHAQWLTDTASTPADRETTGLIIVKTSTVGIAVDIEDLVRAVDTAWTSLLSTYALSSEMDLFYFAKWLDRPEQYQVLASLSGGGKIIRTWNPNGLQALAVTPSGIRKLITAFPPEESPVVCRPFAQVLNVMVQRGAIVAASTTPALLSYDATLISLRGVSGELHSPFSYLRTCETRGDTHPERPLIRRVSANLNLFWVVIIIACTCVAIWIVIQSGIVLVL